MRGLQPFKQDSRDDSADSAAVEREDTIHERGSLNRETDDGRRRTKDQGKKSQSSQIPGAKQRGQAPNPNYQPPATSNQPPAASNQLLAARDYGEDRAFAQTSSFLGDGHRAMTHSKF